MTKALNQSQRRSIQSWASQNSSIRRVILFGSRVKGTHHQDSDLDIAIEIEPGEDSDATLAKWMYISPQLKAEIQTALPLFTIDLQWLDTFGSTKIVKKATDEARDVVYQKTVL